MSRTALFLQQNIHSITKFFWCFFLMIELKGAPGWGNKQEDSV